MTNGVATADGLEFGDNTMLLAVVGVLAVGAIGYTVYKMTKKEEPSATGTPKYSSGSATFTEDPNTGSLTVSAGGSTATVSHTGSQTGNNDIVVSTGSGSTNTGSTGKITLSVSPEPVIGYGPGGTVAGASVGGFINATALIGARPEVREAYFAQQATAGNLYGTTGSIYDSTAGTSTITKYSIVTNPSLATTWVVPIGAGGAAQDCSLRFKLVTYANGYWELKDPNTGEICAGGGEGSAGTTAYATPYLGTKSVISTAQGSLGGSGIVSAGSQGLVITADGSKYRNCTVGMDSGRWVVKNASTCVRY